MRVAVVGSGVGGLLASALLRRHGIEAVRYEARSDVGGRARSLMLGGLPVNPGPRAVYRSGPFERMLASLDIKPTGFSPKTQGTLALVHGAVRPLPSSLGELLGDRHLSGAGKRALAKAFARIAVGALDVDEGETMGAWLARHVADDDARAIIRLLLRVATYSDDDAHDAKLALLQARRALAKGVTYVDGGWSSIVGALAACAGDARIERVTALDAIDADHVIVALPLDDARALVPSLPAARPVTAACFDVVMSRLPVPAHRVALGIDRPHYCSVHTRPSSPGPFIVHAMVNGSAPRSELESIMDAVHPGWRDVVVEARYLSRMVVASSLPLSDQGPVVDVRTHLVGDYLGQGLLADAVASSVRAAVDAIVAHSLERAA